MTKQEKIGFDVAIIGGGISGLTSAALLQRAGLSTCVLEMNPIPGGYLQGFQRQSFQFDSAIHWLNSCSQDGFVSRIFQMIGTDYPKAKQLSRIRRFVSKDFDYLVSNQPDKLQEQWIKQFPEEENGIRSFFADARKIAQSFRNHKYIIRSVESKNGLEKLAHYYNMLHFITPFIKHVKYTGKNGMQKGLKKYFGNAPLVDVFSSEPDLLSCLIPIAFAYNNDYQASPVGGSQSFADWLVYAIHEMGGEIHFNAKVNQILVENNTAVGVRYVKKGEQKEIRSKYVVAANDLETVFNKLLPENAIPQKVKSKLNEAKLYSSAFTVTLGLDCPAEELGFDEEAVYLADTELSRDELSSGDPLKSGMHIWSSSVRDKSLALAHQGTLSIFIPSWIESHHTWDCELDEEGNYIKGTNYKKLKQEIAEHLIDRVEAKICPVLRKHIVLVDIATPITHHRYTGNKDGSMMGQKPGKENMQAGLASYQTPVKNLYRSGHWADLGGGVPIAVKTALNSSLIILKKEKHPAFPVYAKFVDGKIELEQFLKSKVLKPYSNSWKTQPTIAQQIQNKPSK